MSFYIIWGGKARIFPRIFFADQAIRGRKRTWVGVGGHSPPFILDGSGHYIFGFRVITIAQSTLFASFVVRVK